MNLEKAMQRIFWRLGNGKFTPNQQDIDSMTFIAEWINRESAPIINDNLNFAKIYTYALSNELEFYGDINFATRKLNDVLKKPLEQSYEEFRETYNRMLLNKYSEKINLSQKHPALVTAGEHQEDLEIIRDNQQELLKHIQGIYTQEQINTSLNNQITEALNRFKI